LCSAASVAYTRWIDLLIAPLVWIFAQWMLFSPENRQLSLLKVAKSAWLACQPALPARITPMTMYRDYLIA